MPLLVAITGSGTLSMHVLLPALPALASHFAAPASEVQLTITLYLLGLAVGQLFYGTLSDRFGRRPLLLGGLALHALASFAACFSPSVVVLIVARLFQALGACAGQVLGRAMVRDGDGDVLRRLGVLASAMSIAPAMAPLAGGYLTTWFGWQAVFVFLGALSTVLLLLSVFMVRETNRYRGGALAFGDLAGSFAVLARIRAYRGYAAGGALGATNMYAYLAAAPFIFGTLLHRPPHDVGFYILIMVVAISGAAVVASRLSKRMHAVNVARLGCGVQITAGAVLMLVVLTDHLTVLTLVAPMMVFAGGTGLVFPSTTALAISVDPRRAGAASALYGSGQMAAGALFTLIVGAWSTGSALPTATVLLSTAVLALVALNDAARHPERRS
ncbi:MAG TPA: multidrug effflux MFS transporter [Burkholderiales bacterium]|nr:multidrug effflux MFS transporter [Burkholderiales bacterium]